jgi:transcriptional regulator with XRE-family HTH domain
MTETTPPRRILGDSVRQLLADRGVRQQVFAAYIGVSESHLSRLLNGQIPLSYEMGVRIARGLGARLGAVMDPADPPGPSQPIAAYLRDTADEVPA